MEATYYCDVCKKRRQVKILVDPDRKVIRNGLIMETDLHHCDSGLLMVYNIFIDDDKNARTVENVEIPAFKKETRTVLGSLPTPSKLTIERNQLKQLQVASLTNIPGVRIVITDAVARYILNLGVVKEKEEQPEFTIFSQLYTIELKYYPSIISSNEHVMRWFQEFVDLIERLPTNHLGNYLSGLRFVQTMCTIEPEEVDLKVLDMLLSSSETMIYAKKTFDPSVFISDKGGGEFESKTLTDLFKLLSVIEKNEGIALSSLVVRSETDIIQLCNKLLILENRDLIEIVKPESIDLNELFEVDA